MAIRSKKALKEAIEALTGPDEKERPAWSGIRRKTDIRSARKPRRNRRSGKDLTEPLPEDIPVKPPRNWPDILKKVPMRGDAKVEQLTEIPVFKDDAERLASVENLAKATTGKDWNKEMADAADQGSVQLKFGGNGECGRIHDGTGTRIPDDDTLKAIGEVRNRDVAKVNRSFTVPGQLGGDTRFILPLPATRLDELDIPEYVMNAFMHPMDGFRLESSITVGKEVRIVYGRDPEYFEAIISIGTQRTAGSRRMEISSLLIKDGASYAVTGKFCDNPMSDDELGLDRPRTARLYGFLCERLGLD